MKDWLYNLVNRIDIEPQEVRLGSFYVVGIPILIKTYFICVFLMGVAVGTTITFLLKA